MNVVDSSAWLEYLAGASNVDAFAPVIEEIDEVLVPAIVITEVARRMFQQRGEAAAKAAFSLLSRGKLVPLDDEIAFMAAELGVRLHRPLADSVVYATAQRHEAVVWTQDGDFDGLPGVEFREKPRG